MYVNVRKNVCFRGSYGKMFVWNIMKGEVLNLFLTNPNTKLLATKF